MCLQDYCLISIHLHCINKIISNYVERLLEIIIINIKFSIVLLSTIVLALANNSGLYHFDDEQDQKDFQLMILHTCDYEDEGTACLDLLLND